MEKSENKTIKKQKTYINGAWIIEKTFQDGSSILKMSILPEKFIDSIKSLKPNPEGFVKLVLSKSLSPKPNNTHYLTWDDFGTDAKPVTKTEKPKTEVKKEDIGEFV